MSYNNYNTFQNQSSGQSLMPIEKNDYAYLLASNKEFEENILPQIFMKTKDGSFFIKRLGLLMKMKMMCPEYSCETTPPTMEEYQMYRMMMGIPEGIAFVVMKATVTLPNGKVVTEFGTATLDNCNAKTQKHLFEMACTRASNRALRVATNCGFASVEELHLESVEPVMKKANVVVDDTATKQQDEMLKVLTTEENDKEVEVVDKKFKQLSEEVKKLAVELKIEDLNQYVVDWSEGEFNRHNMTVESMNKLKNHLTQYKRGKSK